MRLHYHGSISPLSGRLFPGVSQSTPSCKGITVLNVDMRLASRQKPDEARAFDTITVPCMDLGYVFANDVHGVLTKR